MDTALQAPRRSAPERARDQWCHPRATLQFFDVRPGQRVLELEPALGYYTKILAEYLGGPLEGAPRLALLVPHSGSEPHPGPFADRALDLAEVLHTLPRPVQVLPGWPVTAWAEPARFDRVLAIRAAHIYAAQSLEQEIYAAALQSLVPGGFLGVVAHRAATDDLPHGYLSEARVIQAVTEAGFVLDSRAEINQNQSDMHQHPHGVWSLPPTLVDGASYSEIGESDRMTLRFRRP